MSHHTRRLGERSHALIAVTVSLALTFAACGDSVHDATSRATTSVEVNAVETTAVEVTLADDVTGDDDAPTTTEPMGSPFDFDPQRFGLTTADVACLMRGSQAVERAHPYSRGLLARDLGELTPSQHDVLIPIIAAVVAECIDVASLKRATVEVVVEYSGDPPELAECWTESLDDSWYALFMADSMIHGGPDDMFKGQQLAAMAGCTYISIEQRRGTGPPDMWIDCMHRVNDEVIAELNQSPQQWREIMSEGANSARGLRCVREFPARSPEGDIRFAESPHGFVDAVTTELLAVTNDGPTLSQATCMAAAMSAGIGETNLARGNPSAAQVVGYLQGHYSADELRFDLGADKAADITYGLLDCVDKMIALLLTLTDGNILDALGRPESPPDLSALTVCAIGNLDRATLRAFLTRQFIEGPSAYVSDEGSAIIDDTFGVVADCADDLGIPHTPPAN